MPHFWLEKDQAEQGASVYLCKCQEYCKFNPITAFGLQSLKRKAEASVGDTRAEMEPILETALVHVADEFITNAISFASGLARRRKAQRLDSADVAVYLDRTW